MNNLADQSVDILLIDANSLGYSAMYQPALSRLEHNGMPTAALHGMMASMFARMNAFPSALPVVLWDGHAGWRHQVLPDYKSNRNSTPEKIEIRAQYRKQVPYLQQLLLQIGIPQIRHPELEADDLAGIICAGIEPSLRVEMVTKDTDWWQALRPGVRWFSPLNKATITLETLADPVAMKGEHYLSTDEYLQCKALAGDTSDCIPGIEKVGMKTAAKIIREYGGMDAFWARIDAGMTVKGVVIERLATEISRKTYRRNLTLMDWRAAPDFDRSNLAAWHMEPDMDEFVHTCDNFKLTKVLSSARNLGKRTASCSKSWAEVLLVLEI